MINFQLEVNSKTNDGKYYAIQKDLKELGFKVEDYGSIAFCKVLNSLWSAIIMKEPFTRDMILVIFERANPENTIYKINLEYLGAIYDL